MEFAVCTCDTLKAAGSGYRREPSKQPVDRSAIMPVFRAQPASNNASRGHLAELPGQCQEPDRGGCPYLPMEA